MGLLHQPPLFHRKGVLPHLREPFIIGGYRKPNSTLKEALSYLFVVSNNECLNFWTHFIPFVAWLTWFWLLSYQIDFSDPYFYPLAALWIGSCSYALCSSAAHMLGCMGLKINQVCFFVDYMGISLYMLGLSLATFFYEFPADSLLYGYKRALLTSLGALCTASTVVSGLVTLYGEKWRFFLKVGAYALPFTVASIPAWQRIAICATGGECDCIAETQNSHVLSLVMTAGVVFFYVSKCPERFAPGAFDAIGQSHQLFHLCGVSATSLHMYAFPTDAILRRKVMAADPNRLPDFNWTLFLFAIAGVINVSFVVTMSVMVMKGKLVSVRERPHDARKER